MSNPIDHHLLWKNGYTEGWTPIFPRGGEDRYLAAKCSCNFANFGAITAWQ